MFTVRLMPEGRPLVVFTRPEHVKEIFAGDPEVFHAGKGNAILGPVMGEHSLLLVDSAEHKRARKLLMPAFNGARPARLRGPGHRARQDRGRRAGRRACRSASLERMNALTLEVILQVVFGVTDEARLAAAAAAGQQDRQHHPAGAARLGLPAAAAARPLAAHGREPGRARPGDLRRDRRAARGCRPGRAHRRALPAAPACATEDGDRASPTSELRDQLVTLLLAGHETTATALAWTLHELGTRPRRSDAQARDAADAGDDGLPRGGAQGVDAAAPGDPDGGAPPDGAGDDRRHRPARAAPTSRPSIILAHEPRGQPPRPRPVPARAVPRRRGRRPTPGSRSAAAYAAASAPASR